MSRFMSSLFSTQFYGVLNDNLLKGLICFVTVFWVDSEHQGLIISLASMVMVMPFILLSPFAGYLAQSYPKQKILQISKLVEIPIMVIALFGFLIHSVALVFISLFLMAVQSAVYSPSKYGLIKELSGGSNVANSVGIMEMLSFVAVLLGTLIAGFISDIQSIQILILGASLMLLAVLGYRSSRKITRQAASSSSLMLKDSINPLAFIKKSKKTSSIFKGVNSSVLGLGVFWLMGSLIQMNLLVHCPLLGYNNTQTGLIMAMVAVGIGLGCWVSGKIIKKRLEIGIVPFAGLGLTFCALGLSFSFLNHTFFLIFLFFAAFFGGLFKVPLNAWIQERVSNNHIGTALAYTNMVVFLFIFISAVLFAAFQKLLSTHAIFLFISILAFLTSITSFIKLQRAVVRFLFWLMAKTIYRLKVTGVENIPKNKSAILMVNHVSLLDAILIIGAVPRMCRFVMHDLVYHSKWGHWFFKRMNMISISERKRKEDLEAFNQRCTKELSKGHIVCLFSEGQISRNGQLLEIKKGVVHMAKLSGTPIIPMHMANVSGSPLSFRTGSSKVYGFGLKRLRRRVCIKIGKPIHNHYDRYQLRQKLKDLEVDNYINLVAAQKWSLTQAYQYSRKQVFRKHKKVKDTIIRSEESQPFYKYVAKTPSYTIKDIAGNIQKLVGDRHSSIGRPLPGVSVRIVGSNGEILNAGEKGQIQFRTAFMENTNWQVTPHFGSMDRAGFVYLSY